MIQIAPRAIDEIRELHPDQFPGSAKFNARVDVKIWTPGSTIGIPVSMVPTMVVPGGRPEDRARACSAIGRALANLINDTSDVTATGLAIIVRWANDNNLKLDTINDLVQLVTAPPMALLNVLAPILDGETSSRLRWTPEMPATFPSALALGWRNPASGEIRRAR